MASTLKVIIAGGGIAGLTLANALEVRFSDFGAQHLLTSFTASKYRLCPPRATKGDSASSRCIYRYLIKWMQGQSSYYHVPVSITVGSFFVDLGSAWLQRSSLRMCGMLFWTNSCTQHF